MPTDDRDVRERLAVVEERLKEMQKDVGEILQTIQGPPRDGSIRGRLHALENADAAARAAEAAVSAAKIIQQQASEKRFSRTEKTTGLLLASVVSMSALVSMLVTLIHH